MIYVPRSRRNSAGKCVARFDSYRFPSRPALSSARESVLGQVSEHHGISLDRGIHLRQKRGDEVFLFIHSRTLHSLACHYAKWA